MRDTPQELKYIRKYAAKERRRTSNRLSPHGQSSLGRGEIEGRRDAEGQLVEERRGGGVGRAITKGVAEEGVGRIVGGPSAGGEPAVERAEAGQEGEAERGAWV